MHFSKEAFSLKWDDGDDQSVLWLKPTFCSFNLWTQEHKMWIFIIIFTSNLNICFFGSLGISSVSVENL